MDRYKARLVARDFTQTYMVDYLETFFSRWSSQLHLCFVLSGGNQQWQMFQLNVKNAFLYGDLDEEAYMEQLPEYFAQRENMVCKLK